MMNAYIAIFLPSVIGITVYKIITKEKDNNWLFLNYLTQVFLANFLTWFLLEIRNHDITNFSSYIGNDFSFSLKYMLLVMVLSILLSIVFAVLKKYFVFEVEVENGRKKKK